MSVVFVKNSSLKPPPPVQNKIDLGNLWSVSPSSVSPSSKEAQMSLSSWKVTRCCPCLSFIIGRRAVLMPREICFQTSRVSLPEKTRVGNIYQSSTEGKCVRLRWLEADSFRKLLLTPDFSFLHTFCLETKTRGCFCFVAWSLAHVDTGNLITPDFLFFKSRMFKVCLTHTLSYSNNLCFSAKSC